MKEKKIIVLFTNVFNKLFCMYLIPLGPTLSASASAAAADGSCCCERPDGPWPDAAVDGGPPWAWPVGKPGPLAPPPDPLEGPRPEDVSCLAFDPVESVWSGGGAERTQTSG